MAQAVQPATAAARERHAAELQQWLASRHCSLTTCSPEALLDYVTMHWLPKHTGLELLTGERVTALSSLANMLPHHSSHFEHIEGRNGLPASEWGAARCRKVPQPAIRKLTGLSEDHRTLAAVLQPGFLPACRSPSVPINSLGVV